MRLLVLTADEDACIGVDLDSGAFVHARHPPSGSGSLACFDLASASIAQPAEPPDPSRPEDVDLAGAPRAGGRLTARRAERYLAPLLHPPRVPLLGFSGPSVPYWTLAGDRPSLALVELASAPHVRWSGSQWQCHLTWRQSEHELPLADRPLARALATLGRPYVSPRDLHRTLGFRPRRAVVGLTPPVEGYCYKVVLGFVPGP